MDNQKIQDLVAGMTQRWQQERAETQMTLGALIKVLEGMPDGAVVCNLHGSHSYRGYYCDLAFSVDGGGTRPVADLLAECRAAMGETFMGYKGGDFMMGATTPLWVAEYGHTGERLMAMNSDGTITTAPQEARP